MAADQIQRQPLPAPVFQKLTGQFDGIPGDAIDTRDRRPPDGGKQMMQSMAEFMKQRRHFVMREQAGRRILRWREIAVQIGDWQLGDLRPLPARQAIVHPGAATFARACV